NVALLGGRDEFLQAALSAPNEGKLDRPVLEKRGISGLLYQLDAQRALWDETLERWVFYNGVERRFQGGVTSEYPFSRTISDLAVPPLDLVPRSRDPEEMSMFELRDYSRHLERLGDTPPLSMSVAFQ